MLKSVIEQKYVHACRLQPPPLGIAVSSNAKKHVLAEPLLHQLDLIARPICSAIASAENSHALPFRQEFLRQPDHHGRFACSAHGQVTDADHRSSKALLLQPALRVKPRTKQHRSTINERQRPQQHRNGPRQFHFFTPLNCFSISANARLVAPRLASTSRLAFSPICAVRSGFRSCSIHATPASSGLSTCTAAPAATNLAAISAKFSVDGPNTAILPNAAGSRMLCPPEGTSEPPTKTPSARR